MSYTPTIPQNHIGTYFEPIAGPTVDSKKLEYEPGAIYAGVPSSQAFGVAAQSYPNFLASVVPGSPGTFNYQSHLFCRLRITSIQGRVVGTYQKNGVSVVNGTWNAK